MYLIDETYFQRELQVPNSQEQSSDGESTVLDQLGDGMPRLFLKDALGYELFKELDSNVTDGVLDVGAPQKWIDLVNGVEYTHDNMLKKKWNGLAYSEGAFKTSILAYFVYHEWLLNQLSTLTGIGNVSIDGKNSENVNSTQDVISIWNTFVNMNQAECVNSYPNVSNVNGVLFTDWFTSSTNRYVSLIEFLKDKADDYPDANLKTYSIKNQFGI